MIASGERVEETPPFGGKKLSQRMQNMTRCTIITSGILWYGRVVAIDLILSLCWNLTRVWSKMMMMQKKQKYVKGNPSMTMNNPWRMKYTCLCVHSCVFVWFGVIFHNLWNDIYDGASVGKNARSQVGFWCTIYGWQEDVSNFSYDDAHSKFFIFTAFIEITIIWQCLVLENTKYTWITS